MKNDADRARLYLDIDGVLNDHGPIYDVFCGILPGPVRELNRLVEATDCLVVLSSAWRYMILQGDMTVTGFEYLLVTHGASLMGRLIGHTPADEEVAGRGDQIAAFQAARPCKRYAVVDDLDLGITAGGHPFVQTDGRMGLSSANVDDLIGLLT